MTVGGGLRTGAQAAAEKRAAALQTEREARRAAEGRAGEADAARLADGRLRRAADRKVHRTTLAMIAFVFIINYISYIVLFRYIFSTSKSVLLFSVRNPLGKKVINVFV